MKACSIDGCEKSGKLRRGWCQGHWRRWRNYGDPLGAGSVRLRDPEAAFLARTEPLVWSDCLIWTGSTTPKGYGQLIVDGRLQGAHRFAWVRVNGPIPDGMHVDHTCHNRACVNVDHLRLATPQQNQWNRSGAWKGRDLPRGVMRQGRNYTAKVKHNGIQHRLGTFPTIEAASEAAATKRSILFGEFAGGN